MNRLIICIFILLFHSYCSSQQKGNNKKMAQLRENMVKQQIKSRGIQDANVLDAMQKVERHKFVPERYIHDAYDDSPLPIGEGQTISQPYIVALMTEKLNLKAESRVLEVGTGSGYQAAILAEICDTVYTIEVVEELGKNAIDLFEKLGYDNIFTKIGDGYKGWAEHAPFDAIIVTCSPTHIPQPLKEQLAEGGRMIIPVGQRFAQELVLLTKKNGKLKKRDIIPVRFVPMTRPNGSNY